jgi:hypothetical protein
VKRLSLLCAPLVVAIAAFAVAASADETPTSVATTTTTTATTTSSPRTPSPAALVLLLSDLPKTANSWRRQGATVYDNKTAADLAGVTVADVAGAGRVTGYFEHFEQKLQRIGTHVLIGCCLDQVTTFVDVFDSDPSADAIFSNRTMRPPWRAVKTSAKIGDELRLFSGTVAPPYGGRVKESAYTVMWRSGPVVVDLIVGGLLATAKDALSLARTQELHIRAALAAAGA